MAAPARWAALALVATASSMLSVADASASFAASASQITAVQKVVEMLQGMLAKGKEDKHSEEVQFSQYKQFCSDVQREKTSAVQTADEEIQMLQANIQLANANAETLAKEVEELDGEIATWQADQKAASKVRELEKADYVKAHQDYADTIEAIGKATQVLKAQAYNRPQAPQQQALAQMAAALQMSLASGSIQGAAAAAGPRAALLAFLALAQDPAEEALRSLRSSSAKEASGALLQSGRQGPEAEAYAYESRSGDVIDMLQQLRDKFVEERSTLEKEEMSKRHGHELYLGDTKSSITNAEDARSTKAQQRAKSLQNSAQMTSSLSDTTSTRADDSKYLSEMTATCHKKAADFEERQKLRADEITAIEKAIELLTSNQVQQSSEKYLASLIQRKGSQSAKRSFLQVGSTSNSPLQLQAATYLGNRAEKFGSSVLLAVAQRAREDPFDKVKKMIRDLITHLQEAAGEEAEHESWCRAELATNEHVRNDRTTSVERLTSEIETKQSAIATLSEEVAELAIQISETDNATAESTKIRNAEKAENTQTVKDAQEAQAAVGQAVTVLKEFYSSAGDATAFAQKSASASRDRRSKQEPPAIFDEAYQGMGGSNDGVIAMLEVIQSDFARLESTTNANEATSQAAYDKQMSDSAVLKAAMTRDVEHKNALKQQYEQSVVDMSNDLQSAQKELNAAEAYYEKLKPSCLESGLTMTERAQRRQEEIESLQEALRILNGDDISVR